VLRLKHKKKVKNMSINFENYKKSLKLIKTYMPEIFPIVNELVEIVKEPCLKIINETNGLYFKSYNGYTYKFKEDCSYLNIIKTSVNASAQFGLFGYKPDALVVSIANSENVNHQETKLLILGYLDNENMNLAMKYGNGITTPIRIWLEKTTDNDYTLIIENHLKHNDNIINKFKLNNNPIATDTAEL